MSSTGDLVVIMLRLFFVNLLLFGTFGNGIHYWAHARSSGKPVCFLVRLLQDWCILLRGAQHRKHHHGTNGNFCIVTGHTNFLVNWVYRFVVYPIAFLLGGQKGDCGDLDSKLNRHILLLPKKEELEMDAAISRRFSRVF